MNLTITIIESFSRKKFLCLFELMDLKKTQFWWKFTVKLSLKLNFKAFHNFQFNILFFKSFKFIAKSMKNPQVWIIFCIQIKCSSSNKIGECNYHDSFFFLKYLKMQSNIQKLMKQFSRSRIFLQDFLWLWLIGTRKWFLN